MLDDAQWADEGTFALLEFVLRAASREPLAVMVTARSDEVGPGHGLRLLLGALAGRAHVLAVAGLTPDALAELAEHIAGPDAANPDHVAELHRRTGGNPFFARELLALGDSGSGSASWQALPSGVRAVIDRRLAHLPNDCVDLLGMAAVVGTTLRIDDLAVMAALDESVVRERLEPAMRAGIVTVDRTDPAGLRFTHDLFRETIHDSQPATVRARAHAAAAEVFAMRDPLSGRAAELAHHLVHAVSIVGVAPAAIAAIRAGHHARSVLAEGEAAAWFRRALDLLRGAGGVALDDGPDEIDLLLALGEAEVRAGHVEPSRAAYLDAAELARRRHRPDQLADAALGLGAGLGGFEITLFDMSQIGLLEEALAALPPDGSTRRAMVLGRLSVAMAFVADESRRLELSDAAVAMARRVGDPATLGHTLAARCDALSGPEHSERRRDLAAEIVAVATRLGDRRLELLGRRHAVAALLELGDMVAVDDQVRRFAVAADVIREPLYRWYVPLWHGMRALMVGDIAASEAACAEAEAIGGAGSANCRMLVVTQTWVRLRVERRYGDAAAWFTDRVADVFGFELPGVRMLDALCHLHAGRPEQARAHVAGIVADLSGPVRDAEWLPTLAQAAELAVELRDTDLAAVVDELLAPFDDRVIVEGIGAAVCGTGAGFRAPVAALLGRTADDDRLGARAASAGAAMGLTAGPWTPALAVSSARVAPHGVARSGAWHRDGDSWVVMFDDQTVRLRESKGMADLAVLLARPGSAVLATELVGLGGRAGQPAPASGLEALDRRALADYRRRLGELDAEVDEADADHDTARAERLRHEKEFLLAELSGAVGLSGRIRRTGDDVDRARKAVRARLRDTIGRIAAVHPSLGRHLERSIRTGSACTYEPERPVEWSVR